MSTWLSATIGFLLLGPFGLCAQTLSTIPQTHRNLPVLVEMRIGNRDTCAGTAFLVGSQKKATYLVTAYHVLFNPETRLLWSPIFTFTIPGKEPADSTHSTISIDMRQMLAAKHVLIHPNADIVLLRLGYPRDSGYVYNCVLSHQFARSGIHVRELGMLLPYDQVIVGNDVYVYGYPSSLGLKNIPQYDYRVPLLRKGIVAGMFGQLHTIILDCPAYPGNSGGPVVQASPGSDGNNVFKIIGVVTQLIPFDEANRNPIPRQKITTNSGYAVVESADRIIELIKQAE